jgi:hypothetical protein
VWEKLWTWLYFYGKKCTARYAKIMPGVEVSFSLLLFVSLLLLYNSALHQHTDDNVPGTDLTMQRMRGV